MIPKNAITEWNNVVPRVDINNVEQDLIICRALVAIYNDDFLASRLAFRGGTALHKLYLQPQPRYSVVKCYRDYISFSDGESPSKAVYLANMEEKMQEEIFLNDMQGLLRPSLDFKPQEAWEVVKDRLIEKI